MLPSKTSTFEIKYSKQIKLTFAGPRITSSFSVIKILFKLKFPKQDFCSIEYKIRLIFKKPVPFLELSTEFEIFLKTNPTILSFVADTYRIYKNSHHQTQNL